MKNEARFGFGKNWESFLQTLTDERIEEAKKSLSEMLGTEDLSGKTFLDIGSGSGLFSLAAYMLGARVYSFDYDIHSVNCTRELQRRYAQETETWVVEEGSVLDKEYLESLGVFDVVYSWGVLHHTGDMYSALQNVVSLVKPGGTLFISLYNDQGSLSSVWKKIKRLYCALPKFLKPLYVGVFVLGVEIKSFVGKILTGRNPSFIKRWRDKKEDRGMSEWHDWVDWIGGYPFEVAKPEEIFEFYKERGFQLEKMTTKGRSHGCNEYVFIKKK